MLGGARPRRQLIDDLQYRQRGLDSGSPEDLNPTGRTTAVPHGDQCITRCPGGLDPPSGGVGRAAHKGAAEQTGRSWVAGRVAISGGETGFALQWDLRFENGNYQCQESSLSGVTGAT